MSDEPNRSSPGLIFGSAPGRRWSLAVLGLVLLSFLLMIAAPGLSFWGYLMLKDAVDSPSINLGWAAWGGMVMVEAALVELGGAAAVIYVFVRKPWSPVLAVRTLLAAIIFGSLLTVVAIGVSLVGIANVPPGYKVLVFGMMLVGCILPSLSSAVLTWLDLVCLRRVWRQRETALS